MASSKEILNEFKKAPWQNEAEAKAFLARSGEIKDSHIKQLINFAKVRPEGMNLFQHQMMHYCLSRIIISRKNPDLALAIIDVLKDADEQSLNTFGYILVKVNDTSWHQKLFNNFKSKRDLVRRTVLKVFSKVGGRSAFKLISERYRENWPSRIEMIDALAKIAGHHAIDLFDEMIPHVSREEKARILLYLSDENYMKAAKEKAGKVLASLLNDKDAMLRIRALDSLGRLGDARYAPEVSDMLIDDNSRVVLAAIAALGMIGDQQSVDALTDMTYHENPTVLAATIKALGDIGTDIAIDPLIRLIEHDNIQVRQQASETLTAMSRSGKINIARMLILMMRSANVNVRRTVVEMIGHLEDKDGSLWWKLIKYLRDEDWWVRERVTEVLLELSGPQIVKHVIELLEDQSEIVRRYAVEVLLKLKDKRGLKPLAKAAMSDPDWWVRERAVEALGEMGDPSVGPVLLQILADPDYQWVCAVALGKLKVAEAVPKLGQLLNHGETDFRKAIMKALVEIGHKDAVPFLQPLLQDLDKDIRLAATQALASFNFKVDTGQLEEQVKESLSFLDSMLEYIKKQGATDLYIVAGAQPCMRRMGRVLPITERVLTPIETEKLIFAALNDKNLKDFHEKDDVDASYESQNEHYRFRVNVYRQATGVNAVFRMIADEAMSFEELGLPKHVLNLCNYHSGLVLVTGPSGAGKSTTLTVLLDYLNEKKSYHIVTIEDPIEYIHKNKMSLVNQREIGAHTQSYSNALRAVLREDPDVILIGEMRDKETIESAITAAETGHLVFGTLHTMSAPKTIDRIIDIFPPHQQPQIRVMISESLRGVICQQLCNRLDGKGRIMALELMLNNDAISNMIRQGKNYQIESVITTSLDQGMRLMDRDLFDLAKNKIIDPREAFLKANDKKMFEPFFEEGELEKMIV